MEEKERLRGLLQVMAEDFDTMADEYEQRISSYEEILSSINETLTEISSEDSLEESPDSVMSDLLMEQDELQDYLENSFPEGLRNGVEADGEAIRSAIEAVQNFQDIRDRLEDSLDNDEDLRNALITCRDIIETALTENKADYARLLENLNRLGQLWEFTQ